MAHKLEYLGTPKLSYKLQGIGKYLLLEELEGWKGKSWINASKSKEEEEARSLLVYS